MITKIGVELTKEDKVSLLRDGVKTRENREEAMGTALSGIGGILGGVTGSISSKLLSTNPIFATKQGKTLATIGAYGMPILGASIGSSVLRGLGRHAVNSAHSSNVFADTHGKSLVPDNYKDNKAATTAAYGAASGAGMGALGYLGAKALYKLHTGKTLVSPVIPRNIGSALLMGTGIGLGRQLLNNSIISGADAAREKYDI